MFRLPAPFLTNLCLACLPFLPPWSSQSLRTNWGAVSWAAVLILPQRNVQSQVVHIFLVDSLVTNEVTLSGLPSFAWTPWGAGAVVAPPAPIHLLGSADEFAWVSPGSQISHTGWDSEFYLVVEQGICPLPVGKILGQGVDGISWAYPLVV